MTYQQATQAFNDLLLRCDRLAADGEEASQLAIWLIAEVCGGISDEQLAQILRIFRFKNQLPPDMQLFDDSTLTRRRIRECKA